MPISEELLKQMGEISDADVDDALLKKMEGMPIHQQIFNKGHKSATGVMKGKVEAAEARVVEAEGKLATLKTEYDQYKSTTPNVATVDAQYKDKIVGLEKKITDLKDAAKNEKIMGKVNSSLARVREILSETIDPVHAESLTDRESIRSRLSSEDGENLRILQPGQQIPYAGDNDAQMKALATELAKDVPAKYLRTDIPKGTGNGATGGAGGGKKAKFDDTREKAKNSNKRGTGVAADPQAELNKALGKTATG